MGLETDLSVSPYYDDANNALADNYHRILFKPSVSVQARELTQLQDILQNQVERFGDNIYATGTIIKGCNFNFDVNYYYTKINDIRPIDNAEVDVTQYPGLLAYESTSNLYAICVNSIDGYQSNDPNLKTLYFKYINSGINNVQQFPSGKQLQFYTNSNPTYANSTNYFSNGDVTIASVSNSVGAGYLMTVSSGVVYQKGHFIQVENNTSVIVDKYSNQPDQVTVGFNIAENIVTTYQDSNLYDQATGSTNYNAPGADRLQLIPTLVEYSTNATPNSNFFSLVEWENGNITKSFQQTEYSSLGNEFARRTYEEAGNFTINPFRIHMESSNSTYNSIVASAGLAYIEGHRIEQLNNIRTPVRKGLDTKVSANQTISVNYDNSILVQQMVGAFPTTTGAIVTLYDTAQNAVSGDTFSPTFSPNGNAIGTAKIISLVYYGGQSGTPTAQYKAYLADIRMNTGKTFASVKAIYSTNSGLADIVLTRNTTSNTNIAVLELPSKSSLVFDTGKVGSASLSNTNVLPNYTYRSNANSLINYTTGNSNIIGLTGSYKFPYTQGIIPASQATSDLIIVPTSFSSGANFANVSLTKTGNVTVYSTNTLVKNATGNTTSFNTEYNTGDYINVANTVRRVVTVINSSSMSVDSAFNSNASSTHNKCYPVNVPINLSGQSYASILDTNSQQLQLSLIAANGSPETLVANMNLSVSYNAIIPSDPDRALQANTSIAVRINVSNNSAGSTGPWCLGIPYVYNLRNVYKSSNVGTFTANSSTGNTYIITNTTGFANGVSVFGPGIVAGSTANVVNSTALQLSSAATATTTSQIFSYGYYSTNSVDDITFAFNVKDGQKDAFFDQSFLVHNSNYQNVGIGPNDLLTVVFDAFYPQNTGKGYISVDSYTTIINNGNIGYENIPSFTDTSGNYYNLRDCIDFRPFAQNTAAYQSAVSNSIINPTYTSNFAATENYLAAPNQQFNYSIKYYVGRIDKLMLNSYGSYSVVEGIAKETPSAPADKQDAMTLATISVPVYPSLATTNLNSNAAQSYLVNSTQLNQTRVYKMSDIATLDHRIQNLEYYTSLNLLESNASALSIQSSVTGANRFKNGIFVDNFSTTDSLDISNPEFRAGLSPSENALIPRTAQTPIGLTYASGTNVTQTGNIITLLNTNAGNTSLNVFMTQKFKSKSRECSDRHYDFDGCLELHSRYYGYPELNFCPIVPTPPPYTLGQLGVSIFIPSTYGGWYSPYTLYSGYTGLLTGAAFNSFIEFDYMTEMAAAGILNRNFGVSLMATLVGGMIAVTPTIRPYSMIHSGYFIAPETGTYTFTCGHKDGVVLQVGNQVIINSTSATTPVVTNSSTINLIAGQYYSFSHTMGVTCSLGGGLSETRLSRIWFSVNGNVYASPGLATTVAGTPIGANKQITSSMFGRDNKGVATGTPNTSVTWNTSVPTNLIGSSGGNPMPGLNIDSHILKVPTTSPRPEAPSITLPTHIISVLSDTKK